MIRYPPEGVRGRTKWRARGRARACEEGTHRKGRQRLGGCWLLAGQMFVILLLFENTTHRRTQSTGSSPLRGYLSVAPSIDLSSRMFF